jgi:hypothetical protein
VFGKIDQYHVLPQNIYNMDEKGMMIGKLKEHKRIFTQASLENGRILGVCEDGNRDWITMVATICADGSWLRPMLIYSGASQNVQDSWIHAVNWETEDVAFTSSETGWTNNDVGI